MTLVRSVTGSDTFDEPQGAADRALVAVERGRVRCRRRGRGRAGRRRRSRTPRRRRPRRTGTRRRRRGRCPRPRTPRRSGGPPPPSRRRSSAPGRPPGRRRARPAPRRPRRAPATRRPPTPIGSPGVRCAARAGPPSPGSAPVSVVEPTLLHPSLPRESMAAIDFRSCARCGRRAGRQAIGGPERAQQAVCARGRSTTNGLRRSARICHVGARPRHGGPSAPDPSTGRSSRVPAKPRGPSGS